MFNELPNLKLSHDDVFMTITELRDAMVDEYAAWTAAQKLDGDAMELIHESLNAYQRMWISSFIERWDRMEKWEDEDHMNKIQGV